MECCHKITDLPDYTESVSKLGLGLHQNLSFKTLPVKANKQPK